MIDIPIIPPGLAGGVNPQEAGTQGIALKLPQGLEKLVKGALVDALVVKPDAAGNPLLKLLSAGLGNTELPVATKLALPQGSEVQIKILTNTLPGSPEAVALQRAGQPVTPQFQAQVVTVDGKPLPPPPPGAPAGFDTVRALLPSLPGQTSPAPTPAPAAGATIVNVTQGAAGGAIITATVVAPDKGALAYLPPSSSAPVSSDTLKLHVLASNVTAEKPVAAPLPGAPSPAQLSAYTKLSGEVPTLQQAAQSFAARHENLPPVQTSSLPQLTANPSFTGVVIGTEKSGEAVLQTPLGLIKLPVGIDLPQGTTLTLEAVSLTSASEKTSAPLPELSARAPVAAQESFTQLAAVLKNPDVLLGLPPQSLQMIPHAADKQFAARLLWFISGAAQGDAAAWLGEPVRRALEESGNRQLLQKLDGAFQNMRTALAEPNAQGWVSLPFPVWDGRELQQGMFHLHRDPEGNKDNRKKKDSRFMVEVNLESTGDLQIDGLVHQVNAKPAVDLVIRSRQPLPDDMRSDIIRIFEETSEQTGMAGSVQFMVMGKFPVHPMESAQESGGIMV